METPLSRLEAVQKKYTELLADMKRLDRENLKSKKRADQVQKEKDQGRSELSKTVSMKEKLEKLCRELTRENKKMKVRYESCLIFGTDLMADMMSRMSISVLRTPRERAVNFLGRAPRVYCKI